MKKIIYLIASLFFLYIAALSYGSEIHLEKNKAAELMFPMVDKVTPELFKSGESVTDICYYRNGAGAWTALAIVDTVTENNNSGMYTIELTAAEMNHDLIRCKFTAANSADQGLIIRTTGDLWSTSLPGSFGAGTAGYILGNFSMGSGNSAVDHNTGGADNLRYVTAGGQGIDNAQIKAYLKSDYDAGNRGNSYVKGYTTTKTDGRWQWPIYLDSGFTYTIIFYKQGAYGVSAKEITL